MSSAVVRPCWPNRRRCRYRRSVSGDLAGFLVCFLVICQRREVVAATTAPATGHLRWQRNGASFCGLGRDLQPSPTSTLGPVGRTAAPSYLQSSFPVLCTQSAVETVFKAAHCLRPLQLMWLVERSDRHFYPTIADLVGVLPSQCVVTNIRK